MKVETVLNVPNYVIRAIKRSKETGYRRVKCEQIDGQTTGKTNWYVDDKLINP